MPPGEPRTVGHVLEIDREARCLAGEIVRNQERAAGVLARV
jgi:hypothetical protein